MTRPQLLVTILLPIETYYDDQFALRVQAGSVVPDWVPNQKAYFGISLRKERFR